MAETEDGRRPRSRAAGIDADAGGSMLTEAETKLTTYRLFWTNAAGRIVAVPDTMAALDDAEAVREAGRLTHGRAVEVWDGARKVAVLNGPRRG